MRIKAIFLLFTLALVSARAEDWTTTDGKTYSEVTIVSKDVDTVTIMYNAGKDQVTIKMEALPADVQKRLDYDPKKVVWRTTDGRVFKDVQVFSHTDDSVTIIDEDGGATVPFSILSPEVQKQFGYDPVAREKAKEAAAAEQAAEKDKEEAEAKQHAADLQAAADASQSEYAGAKKISMPGQVFIATAGGQNIRLGGTAVDLYSYNSLAPLELDRMKTAQAAMLILKPQFDAAKQAYDDDADKATDALSNGSNAQRRVALAQQKADLETLRSAATQLYACADADYYFQDIGDPLEEVESDADGNFTIDVPVGMKVVLVATGDRTLLDGSTEKYYWMFTPSDPHHLLLSNRNLTSEDGDNSLIHTVDGREVLANLSDQSDKLDEEIADIPPDPEPMPEPPVVTEEPEQPQRNTGHHTMDELVP